MGKFTFSQGKYVVYAKDGQTARQVGNQELRRVKLIRGKMAELLSRDGAAIRTFARNSSEENLKIQFYDEETPINDDPNFLSYRYDDKNVNTNLAQSMVQLMPVKAAGKTSVVQERAMDLIARLALRGNKSADEILAGKIEVPSDLINLLAVAMRNDFDQEMSFEDMVENKIDALIEHSNGMKEPMNTFFYGMLNDPNIVEAEFDNLMGAGRWKKIAAAIAELQGPNVSQERYEKVFQVAKAVITEFADRRMEEKHKEAVARDGDKVPGLESKKKVIEEMSEVELPDREEEYEDFILPTSERDEEEEEKPEVADSFVNQYGEVIQAGDDPTKTVEENDLEDQDKDERDEKEREEDKKERVTLKDLLGKAVEKTKEFAEKRQREPETAPELASAVVDKMEAQRNSFESYLTGNGAYQNRDVNVAREYMDPENVRARQEQRDAPEQDVGMEI